MKIIEAINKVDSQKPNAYTQIEKLAWLSQLDWSVKEEIIDTHEGADAVSYNGYNEQTPMDTEMLVPSPYDEVYLRWLEARIDYANGEYGKYNNSITMYNHALAAYERFYNREHLPLGKRFKFW